MTHPNGTSTEVASGSDWNGEYSLNSLVTHCIDSVNPAKESKLMTKNIVVSLCHSLTCALDEFNAPDAANWCIPGIEAENGPPNGEKFIVRWSTVELPAKPFLFIFLIRNYKTSENVIANAAKMSIHRGRREANRKSIFNKTPSMTSNWNQNTFNLARRCELDSW